MYSYHTTSMYTPAHPSAHLCIHTRLNNPRINTKVHACMRPLQPILLEPACTHDPALSSLPSVHPLSLQDIKGPWISDIHEWHPSHLHSYVAPTDLAAYRLNWMADNIICNTPIAWKFHNQVSLKTCMWFYHTMKPSYWTEVQGQVNPIRTCTILSSLYKDRCGSI